MSSTRSLETARSRCCWLIGRRAGPKSTTRSPRLSRSSAGRRSSSEPRKTWGALRPRRGRSRAPAGWPQLSASAKSETGLDPLLDAIVEALPESPPLYGEEELTDRPMRWLCGEMIREALFELLDQELPYSMAVDVLRYDESGRKALKIGANLLVERESQKRIVVGKGGAMIKQIGIRSRRAIEEWVGRQVHLDSS